MTTTIDQPGSEPAAPRRREILGPTGLVVMVVLILAFTAVSIVIELASNWGKGGYHATVTVGRASVGGSANEVPVVFHVVNNGHRAGHPDKCEASLFDLKDERVGTASVSLHEDIPPGQSVDFPTIGTVAAPAVNGQASCRSLEPD